MDPRASAVFPAPSPRDALGEKPATGGVEVALKTIKNLLSLHRGELREWHGRWEAVDAPLPDNPDMWHEQFFPPHAEDPRAISTVLSKQPATGGWPGGHLVRVASVLGLADLFYDHGQTHSVRACYHVWTHLRVFAHRRASTKAKSRQRNVGHW